MDRAQKSSLLAEGLSRSIFIIKNHGPDSEQLAAQNGDQVVLVPGAVRATHDNDRVRLFADLSQVNHHQVKMNSVGLDLSVFSLRARFDSGCLWLDV